MTEVLIASNLEEAEEYKKAYSGLLDDAQILLAGDPPRRWMGMRVHRVFVTETVDENCNVVWYTKNGLTKEEHGDIFPIWLRYDWRRYGHDYKNLLKKYILANTEAGEVEWEPGELEEIKRLAAE